MSWYQKGKTNLDFTEARESEWQWHQLGHMQVCTLLQTDNHANTSPLSFLQGGCLFCRPTNSVKALKAFSLAVSVSVKSAINTKRYTNPRLVYLCRPSVLAILEGLFPLVLQLDPSVRSSPVTPVSRRVPVFQVDQWRPQRLEPQEGPADLKTFNRSQHSQSIDRTIKQSFNFQLVKRN